MKMRMFAVPLFAIFLFSSAMQAAAPAGPPPQEKKIGRYIGLAAGTFAGFLIGYRVSDDDAVNSSQKLARNVVIGSVLGGVGGFFLGRAVDQHSFQRPADPVMGRQIRDRLVDQEAERLRALLGSTSDGGHAAH